MRVGILLPYRTHLHARIISLRGESLALKVVYPRHLFLSKFLSKVWKVIVLVHVCHGCLSSVSMGCLVSKMIVLVHVYHGCLSSVSMESDRPCTCVMGVCPLFLWKVIVLVHVCHGCLSSVSMERDRPCTCLSWVSVLCFYGKGSSLYMFAMGVCPLFLWKVIVLVHVCHGCLSSVSMESDRPCTCLSWVSVLCFYGKKEIVLVHVCHGCLSSVSMESDRPCTCLSWVSVLCFYGK